MGAKKVLLVEDNDSVRQLIHVLLEGEGYEIIEAADGVDGLAKAESDQPDLMILDLMMPDVDGERVLQQLQADPSLSEIPVLVVSGRYEAIERLRQQIGEENIFPKPFEPTRLMDRIGDLIGHPFEAPQDT
ncbi:MAG: response regulator [Actinomycetota bacterium]